MGEHPDWTFDSDEPAPQEFPAEATALAPAPRDEDGRIVRVDWGDGPKPPPPDANFEPPYDAEQNGETESPGSFDELDPTAQSIFRDQAGLDTAQASVATVKATMGDRFAEMDSEFEELPSGAKMVVASLLSVDWKPHGPEVMADALDQLMDTLPLVAEAELREFLEDHGFIEG